MVLANGSTVTGTRSSATTYTLYYQLAFYDDNTVHYDDQFCNWCYFDIGTEFVGVPWN